MKIGGFKRLENFIVRKWYITAPLALIPIFAFSSIGMQITARQASTSSLDGSLPVMDSNESTESSDNDTKKNPKSVKGTATASPTSCDIDQPMTSGLSSATNLILRKLSQYEKLCGGAVTDTLMIFSGMPTTESSAKTMASDMSSALKEFSKFKLTPLVIMEPTTSSGLIDLQKFNSGDYDEAFNTYFQTLKSSGIEDDTMGIWAPFPESNIPEWGSTNSSLFSANFVKAAKIQKKYFPTSKISIVLDSLSYPPGELDWGGGKYVSLKPYLSGIPKGLVDSFGYQGFPWAAPANKPNYSNYDASKFLKPSIAQEAAQLLGTKHVWLNTGTFRTFHAQNPDKKVVASTTLRTQILNDIAAQASWLKKQGFKVTVSLFAENKSKTTEGVDWSYWPGSNPTGEQATILKKFLANLRAKDIGFWLFDTV